MVDVSEYKVGVVLTIDTSSSSKSNTNKTLKICHINIGDETNPITVVTNAPNVREGSRVAVAPVGSTIVNEQGEEMILQKVAIGGVMSEGMLCDSRMLGWLGGAEGIAVQIPDTIPIGQSPPSSKPRPKEDNETMNGSSLRNDDDCLFKKKLSKEEKKKLAEEKKNARKAAKEAKKEESSS